MRCEWDPGKARANRRKHGLSFAEPSELFLGDDYLEIFDEAHSEGEDRFIAVGPIRAGVITVVYTERNEEVVRIISARRATKNEAQLLQRYRRGIE